MSSKYFPDVETQRVPWADKFVDTVDAHQAEWGISGTEVTEVRTLLFEFKTFYEQARNSVGLCLRHSLSPYRNLS